MDLTELICHRFGLNPKLVKLKLKTAKRVHRESIVSERNAIHAQNRANLNLSGIDAQIYRMEVQKADELAGAMYAAFCDALQTAGKRKSAEFVRMLSGVILPAIRARGNALSDAWRRHAHRTGQTGASSTPKPDSIGKPEEDWRDSLETEALELEAQEKARVELAAQRAASSEPSPRPQPLVNPPAVSEAPHGTLAEVPPVPPARHSPLPPKKSDYSNLMDPAGLTDKQRECFSLKHEYQLSVAEIARRLERNRKTIDEHIMRAEARVQQAATRDTARKRSARSEKG